MTSPNDRREFITHSATAGVALSLAGGELFPQEQPTKRRKPLETVRVGFVGVGVKGSAHVGNLLRMDGVELRTVCDVVERQCVETVWPHHQGRGVGLQPGD